jgi:alkanesulfonate monooxygenase SsuD/methylene tetrahydromethanopterin reductase-like flavin-dependent oxidoreductase (luciferase family)
MRIRALSVLDHTHAKAPANTIELASIAEGLGYARYWLTEHQLEPYVESFVPLLAGTTERIRVGAAGVLINHHMPPQVVASFALHTKLFGPRIDLGVCAGLVERLPQQFPEGLWTDFAFEKRVQIVAALAYGMPELAPAEMRTAIPAQPMMPIDEVWVHGSGPRTTSLAAELGLGLGLTLLHPWAITHGRIVEKGPELARIYRRSFRPHGARREPALIIAVGGVCAATSAEAEARVERSAGGFVPMVVGDPPRCRERLEELADRFETDEVVFMDLSTSFEQRKATFTLLAEELGLLQRSCEGA